MRQFYFGDAIIDENTTMICVDLFNDLAFIYPNYKSLMMHLKYSKGKHSICGNMNLIIWVYMHVFL